VDDTCGTACACDAGGGATVVPAGCSLSGPDAEVRVGDWRAVLAAATGTTHADGGVTFTFPSSPALAAELAGLCAAETACCPAFEFTIAIGAAGIALTIGGDPEDVRMFTR
jgi:hypothetical protein